MFFWLFIFFAKRNLDEQSSFTPIIRAFIENSAQPRRCRNIQRDSKFREQQFASIERDRAYVYSVFSKIVS